MKRRKKGYPKKIITILIIGVLLFMITGYAALTQILYIEGYSEIKAPEYKIVIKSINQKLHSAGTTSGGYQNATPSFTDNEAVMYSVLPNLDSKIIYEIKIQNAGLTSGVLDHLFVMQDNDNFKYKVGGINAGDILAAGESVIVTLEIEYWDVIGDTSANTVSSMINFEFIPYTSEYSNECTLAWDGSSTSEPTIRNIYGLDYYQISNANELAWFSNEVNSGNSAINAILTDNVCLNSKTFTQIGTTAYTGVFDGQNRTIKDYSFSQSTDQKENYTSYAGLFRNNQGYIKNTNLTVNISDNVSYKPPFLGGNHTITEYIGGLVTNNSGLIANSSVSGSINNTYKLTSNCSVARPNGYYYVGGIAASNSGVITGSYNKTNITVSNSLESSFCNYSKYEHLYEGGIVGDNSGYISDSYNREAISSHLYINHKNTEYYGYVGGLVGNSTAGTIKNAYSVGAIAHTTDIDESDSDTVIDTISGCAIGGNASNLTNVYFENTCTFTGNGTAASPADMKDPSLDVEYFLGSYFKTDKNNINDNYPVLKWQK